MHYRLFGKFCENLRKTLAIEADFVYNEITLILYNRKEDYHGKVYHPRNQYRLQV